MNIQCRLMLASVFALAGLAGCRESSPPSSPLDGHYVLALVDDKSLPAVIAVSGFTGLQERVSSGTLDLRGNKATQETDYDQRTTAGTVTPTVHDSTGMTFTMASDILLLRHVDGSVTVTDTAYVSGSTLVVRQKLKTALGLSTPQRFTLKYVRE